MIAIETELLSYAEAARRLGRTPRAVSVAVWSGKLDPSGWPTVGGKRLIPADQLPAIDAALGCDRRFKRNRTAKV